MLDAQAVYLIVDFGDLPVFKATAYPSVIVWQKQKRNDTTTTWAVIEDLQEFYNAGVREYISRVAHTLPASQFGVGKTRLAASSTAGRCAKMEASGQRLGDIAKGQIGQNLVVPITSLL